MGSFEDAGGLVVTALRLATDLCLLSLNAFETDIIDTASDVCADIVDENSNIFGFDFVVDVAKKSMGLTVHLLKSASTFGQTLNSERNSVAEF